MGKINAGQLNQRVTLLTTALGVEDGRGGYLAGGPDVETPVWARVRPLSTGEKLRLGQIANSRSYEVTIRNLPLVSAKQRVAWNGQTLDVQGVVPDEYAEYLLLSCIDGGQ